MGDGPIRIIQVSDIHLYGDMERTLLGVNTNESYQAVVDLLKQQASNADFLLLTGDLTQDGSEAGYKRIAKSLNSFNFPAYCIPGNHDNAKMMEQVYPLETISTERHIILKNWHLILLDSQIPGAVEGRLDVSQLNYLQHCLQSYPQHHAIIVFHHQPVPVGSHWLDNLGLKNATEFWEVISHYPKVHTVLFGHVHQEYEQVFMGIKCYSTPATCFQFMRNQDRFGLENLPPAYRWIELYEDGRLETGVKRVAKYVGEFDAKAKGY